MADRRLDDHGKANVLLQRVGRSCPAIAAGHVETGFSCRCICEVLVQDSLDRFPLRGGDPAPPEKTVVMPRDQFESCVSGGKQHPVFPTPPVVVFEQVEGSRGLLRDARDEVRFGRPEGVRGDSVVSTGVHHGDGNVVAAQGAHRLEGRDGAFQYHGAAGNTALHDAGSGGRGRPPKRAGPKMKRRSDNFIVHTP